MKIFVAGATGAIGLPLVRSLCALGHEVTGMTRTERGSNLLRELGAVACLTDAFDAQGVRTAMSRAEPEIVIDQLTSLPADAVDIFKAVPDDIRLHRYGGTSLLTTACELGVQRYVMQSKGFHLAAPAGQLAGEDAKFRCDAPGVIGEVARAMHEYEDQVLKTSGLACVALRYGFFYGPGTWYRPEGAIADQARRGESLIVGEGRAVWSFVHIDDAVAATVAALTAEPGIYNIVDDDPLPVEQLLPAFANWVKAPEPRRIAVEDALKMFGEETVYYHTALTGAANGKAKAKLGFRPRRLAWMSADDRRL